ncbi:MAG: SDR family oxidoreductase [Kiloniellales bacterium]|nr:SDR family oxidoreductase [Kiloniellales bacterium]
MLQGKVAAISGAASKRGIGLASARAMAAQGGRVAILDLDAASAAAAAESLGDGHLGLACDVVDPAACDRAVREVSERLGPIDILVNNAGITQPLKLMDIKLQDYEAVTRVNLRGTLQLSQAVVPAMRERRRGSIICISSVSAQRGGGIFGGPHYSAAKAGILGLTRAMARELGPHGIRVNAVTPGLIETDITGGLLTEPQKAEINKTIPLGRLGRPEDVADICLFLASDLSAYVTGATIDVNGGMHIH